jgi:monofunctional glycosyltransferase
MAEKPATTASGARKSRAKPAARKPPVLRRLLRWGGRALAAIAAFYAALILVFAVVPPPINVYQVQEAARLGGIRKDWVPMSEIAPVMARSAVAAEDADFCLHWGFDMNAIRDAISEGGGRGASTISQQTVKNVFLWQGRSWVRKAMEALLTPPVELVWTKRRMLEVYLNVAEFGEGVFGVQAAAQHYFGVNASELTPVQAARLAAALPDPKDRNPSDPSAWLRRRAGAILAGAETIRADGRAGCFERTGG